MPGTVRISRNPHKPSASWVLIRSFSWIGLLRLHRLRQQGSLHRMRHWTIIGTCLELMRYNSRSCGSKEWSTSCTASVIQDSMTAYTCRSIAAFEAWFLQLKIESINVDCIRTGRKPNTPPTVITVLTELVVSEQDWERQYWRTPDTLSNCEILSVVASPLCRDLSFSAWPWWRPHKELLPHSRQMCLSVPQGGRNSFRLWTTSPPAEERTNESLPDKGF